VDTDIIPNTVVLVRGNYRCIFQYTHSWYQPFHHTKTLPILANCLYFLQQQKRERERFVSEQS